MEEEAIQRGYCGCGCGERTAPALITDARLGWKKGEPVKFRRGHNGRLRGRYKDLSHYTERGHDYLSQPCWIWQGYTNGRYGVVHAGGSTVYAHRMAYESAYGDIPNGQCVCHRCDVPLCINPSHLFVGTHADNVADMMRKGRNADPEKHWTKHRPGALRGENNGAAKLNEAQVKDIKRLIREGMESHREIALRFGVAPSTISAISAGVIWSTVKEEEQCVTSM